MRESEKWGRWREERRGQGGREEQDSLARGGLICARHINRVIDMALLGYNLNKAAAVKQKCYVTEVNNWFNDHWN